jgi:hypothetical protein
MRSFGFAQGQETPPDLDGYVTNVPAGNGDLADEFAGAGTPGA